MKGKTAQKQQQSRNQRRRALYASLPTNPQTGKKQSRYALKRNQPLEQTAQPHKERPRHSFVCPWCNARENGQPHFPTCPKS